ncbi:sensor histidine kinase [Sphaerotilus sulfidivorans]|uniref:sensor histidine kinase n=1 Tax=Sphaerotilus sp. FB-3 TaxID=2913396 RepID=UPI00203DFC8D|nr:PAS domain-containing sensor histidine kinase [Sphaerotilus sp. FB-3]GKQ59508.1 hypothetical protein QMTAC487_33690 [Sphaerotilus sp. FB-3]
MSATVPPDLLAALVPDAAVLVDDGDGLVRGFNTAAAQLFGPGLQPGRAMCTLIGAEHQKALQALLAEPSADPQTETTVAQRLPLRLEIGAPAGLSPRAMLRVGLRHAGLRLWQFEELGGPERQQADWLLARFMRLSPGAPFALELDGAPARLRFTIISPGLCRAFGRDEHELAAPDFRVLPHVHAQDRDALAQAMREAALHLTDFHHEFRLLHPLRGPVWHEARATVEIDATGRPGAFGRDEHELAAPDFRVLPHVHAQDRDALAQAMREAALHLTDFHHEFRLMHPLRGPVWHEARATVEIDATGRPGAYGYLLDISARKRAEQQLEAMHAGLEQRVRERTAELEAKHREMERFTYSVSHDLKAPLRGLDGYSRLLLAEKRDQLDDEGRLFIDNIRQAARQMSQLIEDLLAYSRVERLRPTLVALPLRGLIDEALAELDDSLRRQAAEIRIDTGTLSVRGERRGLLLVLRNLLDNAIKFRRPDRPCQITITARPLEAPGGGTELTIADNGIGFDMRYHDRIFEIFQRLHRVEDYPGTGIGLAIVRKAMERMNGRIHARAEPGRGATFVLEFPPAAGSIGGQDP